MCIDYEALTHTFNKSFPMATTLTFASSASVSKPGYQKKPTCPTWLQHDYIIPTPDANPGRADKSRMCYHYACRTMSLTDFLYKPATSTMPFEIMYLTAVRYTTAIWDLCTCLIKLGFEAGLSGFSSASSPTETYKLVESTQYTLRYVVLITRYPWQYLKIVDHWINSRVYTVRSIRSNDGSNQLNCSTKSSYRVMRIHCTNKCIQLEYIIYTIYFVAIIIGCAWLMPCVCLCACV